MNTQTKVENLLELIEKREPNKSEALYYLEQQINGGLYKNAEQTANERKIYIDSIQQIDNIAKSNGIELPGQDRLAKAFSYITSCSDDDFWNKGFPSFASFRKGLWSQLTDSGD